MEKCVIRGRALDPSPASKSMHRQQITGTHPRARHLDKVIGFIRARVGCRMMSGRAK